MSRPRCPTALDGWWGIVASVDGVELRSSVMSEHDEIEPTESTPEPVTLIADVADAAAAVAEAAQRQGDDADPVAAAVAAMDPRDITERMAAHVRSGNIVEGVTKVAEPEVADGEVVPVPVPAEGAVPAHFTARRADGSMVTDQSGAVLRFECAEDVWAL